MTPLSLSHHLTRHFCHLSRLHQIFRRGAHRDATEKAQLQHSAKETGYKLAAFRPGEIVQAPLFTKMRVTAIVALCALLFATRAYADNHDGPL